jgi:hypothetical protein
VSAQKFKPNNLPLIYFQKPSKIKQIVMIEIG